MTFLIQAEKFQHIADIRVRGVAANELFETFSSSEILGEMSIELWIGKERKGKQGGYSKELRFFKQLCKFKVLFSNERELIFITILFHSFSFSFQ